MFLYKVIGFPHGTCRNEGTTATIVKHICPTRGPEKDDVGRLLPKHIMPTPFISSEDQLGRELVPQTHGEVLTGHVAR